MKTPPGEPKTLFDRYREAGLADHLVSEMDRRLKKRRRRRLAAARATVAALVLLGAGIWTVTYLKGTATVIVPSGSQSMVTLADGSRAELNAHTQFKTDFRFGRRVIHFDHGEVFFSVVHDPAHPFLVETPAGTVRVTGTQFNVRLGQTGRTEVILIEGRVTVESARPTLAGPVNLTPGQQATLSDSKPLVRSLTTSDLDRELAWRNGKIVLDGIPLRDAVSQFAEYHGCAITVDPSVAGLRLGGTYSLKNLTLFLEALKSTGSVQILSAGDGSYRIIGR